MYATEEKPRENLANKTQVLKKYYASNLFFDSIVEF